MERNSFLLVVFLAFVLIIPSLPDLASADDSFARIAAGGIEFTKTDDIRMLEEVLTIKRTWVNVRFLFLNESDQDITTMVAFPLPPYSATYLKRGPDPDPRSIMDSFEVSVDGRRLSKQVARKAMVGDRDVTARLREIGLSDQQIFGPLDVTSTQREGLQKLLIEGVLKESPNCEGPDWQIHETVFWQQTFPAGRKLRVEHDYRPIGGLTWTNLAVKGDIVRLPTPLKDENSDQTCLDDTRNAVERWVKTEAGKKPKLMYLFLSDVEYVLSTGRNWKGPIGLFTLRIEKDTPDQLTLFCFPGEPKQVSPTGDELQLRDFVPPNRLVVYFYTLREDL